MVLPPLSCTRPIWQINYATSELGCEQRFNGVSELRLRIRLLKEVCALNRQSGHFVGNRIACRVEHTQFRLKLDGLACKFKPAEGSCFETDIGDERIDVLRRT